jgi:hypothetical protein
MNKIIPVINAAIASIITDRDPRWPNHRKENIAGCYGLPKERHEIGSGRDAIYIHEDRTRLEMG